MPHSPPVPPGNQSPYPIAEKPHIDADVFIPTLQNGLDGTTTADAGVRAGPEERMGSGKDVSRSGDVGTAVKLVAGVLAVAIAASIGVVFARKMHPENTTGGKRTTTAKQRRSIRS
jgi:hypothetical protein